MGALTSCRRGRQGRRLKAGAPREQHRKRRAQRRHSVVVSVSSRRSRHRRLHDVPTAALGNTAAVVWVQQGGSQRHQMWGRAAFPTSPWTHRRLLSCKGTVELGSRSTAPCNQAQAHKLSLAVVMRLSCKLGAPAPAPSHRGRRGPQGAAQGVCGGGSAQAAGRPQRRDRQELQARAQPDHGRTSRHVACSAVLQVQAARGHRWGRPTVRQGERWAAAALRIY